MTVIVTPRQRAECARRAMEVLQQMRPCWMAYATMLVDHHFRCNPDDEGGAFGVLDEATADDALFWHVPVLRAALNAGSPVLALRRRLRQAINRRAYLVESSLVVPVKGFLIEQATQEAATLGQRMLRDVDLYRVLMVITPGRLLDASDRICELLESHAAEMGAPQHA